MRKRLKRTNTVNTLCKSLPLHNFTLLFGSSPLVTNLSYDQQDKRKKEGTRIELEVEKTKKKW